MLYFDVFAKELKIVCEFSQLHRLKKGKRFAHISFNYDKNTPFEFTRSAFWVIRYGPYGLSISLQCAARHHL
jgi:hypothetical protein